MLVLRTSNFQGATIRPIYSSERQIQKFKKRKINKTHLREVCLFDKLACVQKTVSTEEYYPSGYFPRTCTMG